MSMIDKENITIKWKNHWHFSDQIYETLKQSVKNGLHLQQNWNTFIYRKWISDG